MFDYTNSITLSTVGTLAIRTSLKCFLASLAVVSPIQKAIPVSFIFFYKTLYC